MTTHFTAGRFQAFDANGDPLSGGKLFTYAAGTTTPQATYTSASLATPNANPVILDAAGRASVWLSTLPYRMVLKTAGDVTITDDDNIGSLSELAGTTGAGLVGYDAAATYPAGTVGDKLQQFTTFRDYGAIGDGVADDTAAVSSALAGSRYWIEGEGLTYKISSSITCTVAHRLTNATFVGTSSIATGTAIIHFAGSEGTPVALTANAAAEAYTATVSSGATFSPEQWVRMRSTAVYAPQEGTKSGEIVRLKGVSGGLLTMYTGLGLPYNTAATATAAPLTMLENVNVENCKFIAAAGTDNGVGLRLSYCANPTLIDVWCQDAEYCNLLITVCADVTVQGGRAERTGAEEGLDYGIVLQAPCYNVTITGWSSLDVRHGVTNGSSDGVSRWVTVSHCHISGSLNAGIDTHSAMLEHSFLYNTVSFSANATTSGDGVISQGARCTMIGNVIQGASRHGFFYQPDASAAVTTLWCLMRDNVGITRNTTVATPGASATLSLATIGTGRTLSADGASFASTDVTRSIALAGDSGVAIITGYTSPTVVTVTISTAFATTSFGSGLWSINSSPEFTGIFCYAITDLGTSAVVSSIIMENNVGQGWSRLAEVYAKNTTIVRAIVRGNHNVTSNAQSSIRCRADSGVEISALEVTGNVATTTGNEGIYILGSGTGRVKNTRISANRIIGGAVASLRIDNSDNVVVDRLNQFSGGAVQYLVDATSTEVSIDCARSPVVAVTGTTYTAGAADLELIVNQAATCTLTLPTPAVWTDRELIVKTIGAGTVVSASSNVQPADSATLGTAILASGAGRWARLRCNGTSWVVMCRGT